MILFSCARTRLRGVSARRHIERQLEALAWAAVLLLAGVILAWAAASPSDTSTDSWPYYGHDAGGMRYSPLTQINQDNVAQLRVSWTFHTGDVSEGGGRRKRSGFETTPLLVDGTLYLTTAFNRIIALDPETGKQRWAYDPKIDLDGDYGDGLVNRGVATWLDATRSATEPCRRRIFESTQDARLVAVDAATGAACADFGKAGQVSLRNVRQYDPGWYHMTSPPTIIDDLVVVGSAIDDNHRVDMARGVVRAYDARSGAPRGCGGVNKASASVVGGATGIAAWRRRFTSVTCASVSYSTRTNDAAKRAISDVSATTNAIGWPLNMILLS